jgi:hypothetical protein
MVDILDFIAKNLLEHEMGEEVLTKNIVGNFSDYDHILLIGVVA